jgi:diaminohydroxyphosphoribosylaminopyrimidine deaminase / 5-amino-6-(5-phosphoribosylamino)uracil reductase
VAGTGPISEPPSGPVGVDDAFMRRALSLAEEGIGLASPNPLVGAVVVSRGQVAGEGWHEGPGTHHAEVMALEQAGRRARGGTLYVTLEPCSHVGRTPPCAPAIREAGIARVVAAVGDPNPLVDGRGFALLRDAGIEVIVGVLESESRRLIAGFLKHTATGLPFVTLKMAASLDGKVAARDGSSRWITGEAARLDVHRLRAACDAVVVGAGTAVADDPLLTVRLDGYRGRQPLRVVVDGSGRTPPTAAVLGPDAQTLMATSSRAPERVRQEWGDTGSEVALFDADDGVSLEALLETLGKRDVQTVLVEGGPTLAWSAVGAGLVDRVVLYVAPKLIGGVGAPGVLGGPGVDAIARALPLSIVLVEQLQGDLKIVAETREGEGTHVHRDH